ncbi:hypothetical protein FRC00_005627, partial [Tulasnella sp. 408]
MANSTSESENEDIVSEVDSQRGLSIDDDTYQDLEFLTEVGGEISTRVPHIWESIGAVWTHATDVLIGQDPEKFDENESDPGYEEDPSYKPIYRVRDIIKWYRISVSNFLFFINCVCTLSWRILPRGAVWVENDNVAEASLKDPILNKIYEWQVGWKAFINLELQIYSFSSRLSTKESPRGSPEPTEREGTPTITEKLSTVYSVALQDLPPELIIEIIQLALKDDPHVVVTISHLSRAFRALALSTPGLWTEVDIMFHEDRVSAHLERSELSPLRVRASLSLLAMPGPSGMRKLTVFIGRIKLQATRIASLEMRYTNIMWTMLAVASLERLPALPNLEEFDYGLQISRPPPRALTARLELACRPRKIRLNGVAIRAFRLLYSERVVSLQVAECWERGVPDWAEALQSMPSLQRLELSDFKIADPAPDENAGSGTTMPPISLPHLQMLSLTRVPRAVLMSLLEALITPNLISATIAFLEPDGLRDYDAPVPWLKPQPTGAGLSDVALLPFVSANPQLQELDLHNCCMAPDM